MARPTIYTEEMAEDICTRLANGETLRTICKMAEMPAISTVLLWVVDGKHKVFSDQYRTAREAQGYYYADAMLVTANDLIDGGLEPSAAKVVIDTYKWVAERNAAKAYGAKKQVDHTSSDGTMSPTRKAEEMTDEELAGIVNDDK